MRLSISSSKFLLTSVSFAVLLFIAYALVIQAVKPEITFFQNQYQSNLIFAQDFIYEEEKPSRVVVGSSMARRMKFKKEDDIYNLAFGGGGPLTGLEIIRRSGYVPKTIYIESNVFTMGIDENFLDYLFPPFLTTLRGEVVALQKKYQILNIVGSILYRFAGRSTEEKLHQTVDEALLEKLVTEKLKNENMFVLKNRETLLRRWHENVDYFKKRGTELVFFEMPVDTRLRESRKHKAVREMIKQAFPEIRYIEENNDNDVFKTVDGVHMTLQSAMNFTKVFKRKVAAEHALTYEENR